MLDQNLKKIPLNLDIEDLSTSVADSIIESVNKVASKQCLHPINISDSWNTNRLKMLSISETNCSKNGCPIQPMKIIVYTESNAIMLQRLFVRPDDSFKKLGSNPTAKTIYRTLKTHKNEVIGFQDYPELNFLNIHSVAKNKKKLMERPFGARKKFGKMRNLNSLTVPKKRGKSHSVAKKWKRGSFYFGMAFYHMLEALDALEMKYLVHIVKVH